MSNVFGITARAYRWYEDDAAETASTAIAAENTAITRASASPNVVLRYGVQESGSGSASGATTDDYQLQVSKNGGAYANVTGASSNVRARASANLTDGGATTNRLSAGSGSFIAGEIDEGDGEVTDWQLTANNFSELLYSLELVPADLANGNTLDFRVLRNGATFNTYSVTPRLTVSIPPPADNAYEEAIFADSPSAVFSMEEASGNITDIWGGLTGTQNGTPTYGVTGPVSGKTAIDFGNVANYFSIPDHNNLDLGDFPLTVEFWYARDDDTGGNQVIINGGTNAYAANIEAGDRMQVGKIGVTGIVRTTQTIPADGSWHHYAWVRDAATLAGQKIYIDGVSVALDSLSPTTALADNALAKEIGRESGQQSAGGKVAYVAFYKSALSGTRIQAHYDAASGASEVTPGAIGLTLGQPAPRIDQEVTLGANAVTLGQPAPSLEHRVDPAALGLTLGQPALSSIDHEVAPAALALALDAPAPSMSQLIDPAALVLALGVIAPARVDQAVAPAAIGLVLDDPAPALQGDIQPATLALALAPPAPAMALAVTPATVTLVLAAEAPADFGQDTSPPALAMTAAGVAPAGLDQALEAPAVATAVTPVALQLDQALDVPALPAVLGVIAPARVDQAVAPGAMSIAVAGVAPVRLDFDITAAANELVLAPLAPVQVSQDLDVTAIVLALAGPAPLITQAGEVTVTPDPIHVPVTQGALQVALDVAPGSVGLTVAVVSPALEHSLAPGPLTLILEGIAPENLGVDVLAAALSVGLATLSPDLATTLLVDPLTLDVAGPAPTFTLEIVSSDGSIRLVSVPARMIAGTTMRSAIGRMSSNAAIRSGEPPAQPE